MKKRSKRGFTLTELLLAAVILAFVLSGLLLLFIHCLFLNESNRNLSIAIMHAQFVMEEIRDATFWGIEPSITTGTWDWSQADITSGGLIPLSNETIDTSVTQSGNPLGISVMVNWMDRNARQRSASLQTSLTDY
ncbi:MAG: type II secretion system GspH family protein [Candidatus Omnitrophica bacterium]|nr:type II secretion system GspH family protein [Candidatus Omnitrophota bacterium]